MISTSLKVGAIGLLLSTAGCGESPPGNSIDADPNAPDADPNAPDADPNAPDANPNAPDARANPDAAGGVGEPPDMEGMTLFHNQVRAQVDTPTPLPSLTWDPALAVIAADWAAQCINVDQFTNILDHNPNRSATYPTYVGENIYASFNPSPAEAVDLWASEESDYNYANNSCSGVCGHYTQIVWRNTLKVGCAYYDCPDIAFPRGIVCNYGPGGNFNGESPY